MTDAMLSPAPETKVTKTRGYRDPVKEAQAAKALRESIGALDDDDQLLIDTIEGETELFEIIDRILERINESEILVDGINLAIDALEVRKDRYAKRAKLDQALIEQALMVADLDIKIERPLGTLYMSNRPRQVIVETETDIPAKYWKAGNPTLDRATLRAELLERAKALDALPQDPEARAAAMTLLPPEIPGVTLNNGGRSLSIRRR